MTDAFAQMIMQQVKTQTDNDMYRNGVMRLGKFIDALKACKPDADVIFDFYGFSPDGLASYRGYYDHLAFGFTDDKAAKVSDILALAEDAMGKTFEGYKGGDFTMGADTPLWVGNYGESRSTAIVGVKNCDWRVILETAYVD